MLDTLWALLMICPAAYSLLRGNAQETAAALMNAGGGSIDLILEMAGGFMLWCGLMEVLRQSGVMEALGRFMRPMLKRLFPGLKNGETYTAIAMNLAANMMGLGNAGTPMGLKAMQLMAEENRHRRRASQAMCVFMVLNSCCVQLLPTTVLTARTAAGSAQPGAIIIPSLVCSLVSTGVGMALCLLWGGSTPDE